MSITADDLDNLRHMLGCEPERARKSWGFRNYFHAGGKDVESLDRLVAAGFATGQRLVSGEGLYSATHEGCRAAEMTDREIARMDPPPRRTPSASPVRLDDTAAGGAR